jgi:hypothetical protein
MDAKTLNKDLLGIVAVKAQLSKLTYDDSKYDKIEEELHDLEDDFLEKYGDYFEEVLENIHEKLNLDNDILLPIAYLPKAISENGKNEDGSANYGLKHGEGVLVDVHGKPGKDIRLALMPNPVRFVLVSDGSKVDVVWKA